jgi:thiamine-monophosphate kinase
VELAVGDDAALLDPGGHPLCIARATGDLDAGDPRRAAETARELVNEAAAPLLAAGAQPAWATLALTLAHAEPSWLESVARALSASLQEHGVSVVGGDTTRGPATLTLHLVGLAHVTPDT